MLIFAIGDNPKLLRSLHNAVTEAGAETEITDFSCAEALLSALDALNLTLDVAFADIKLRGANGLELAVKIKNLTPQTKLILVKGKETTVTVMIPNNSHHEKETGEETC